MFNRCSFIRRCLCVLGLLLCFSHSGFAEVVDTNPILTFSGGHTDNVFAVAFSPDGTKVLTGSLDKTAKLWDVETGEVVRTLSGHASQVWAVAFSPDGTKVLTGSGDGTAKLWDVETGEVLRTLSGHTNYVRAVAFSPDGSKVLTGSGDYTAKLWDVETGEVLRTLSGHRYYVLAVAFSPDGKQVLTGSGDYTAKLWDIETEQVLRTLSGHTDYVLAVAFSPDGTKVLTGSYDETAKLWDVDTGQVLRTFSGHTRAVNSVAFSPDGTQVLTGSSDRTAKLWDVETGEVLRTLSGHTGHVESVAFSPDGTKVLTGSMDDTAKLWSLIDRITGTVTDLSTGFPIASVTLTTSSGVSTQSGSWGEFVFTDLSGGVYSITASKTGYQTITIEDLIVVDDQATEVNVELPVLGFLNIVTLSLPSAETGVQYNSRVRVAGGVYPYTFSIGVTDSQGAYAEQEYTIVVTEELAIVTSSPLPRGTRGTDYFINLQASGGTSPHSFSRSSGSLPPGVSVTSSGNLSGTPTSAGAYSFAVHVTDASGRTAEKQFNIEIVNPVTVSTSKLNDGIVGQVYNQMLNGSGGYGGLQWEVYSGVLPAGLRLDRTSGALSGTPLEETYGTIVFAVSDEDGRIAFQDFSLRMAEPLQILTAALPDGLRNEEYSELIRVRGGIEPLSIRRLTAS